MKYAPIVAPNGSETTDFFRLSYHLYLAQYLAKDDEYVERAMNDKRHGHFIILDNGAAEHGVAIVPQDALLAIAQEIGADEIVLPDAQHDKAQTLNLSRAILQYVPEKNRFIVPQGENWTEWEDCLTTMVDWGCATIGLPKLLEEYPGGRKTALKIVIDYGFHKTHHIHMLGFFGNPIVEIRSWSQYHDYIRGVDSAAPFAWAQEGASIETGIHCSYKWGGIFNTGIATKNISTLLDACGGF